MSAFERWLLGISVVGFVLAAGLLVGHQLVAQHAKDQWYARFKYATPDEVPEGCYPMPNGNFEIPEGMMPPSPKPTVPPMPHAH